jgi:hypothetical protein
LQTATWLVGFAVNGECRITNDKRSPNGENSVTNSPVIGLAHAVRTSESVIHTSFGIEKANI